MWANIPKGNRGKRLKLPTFGKNAYQMREKRKHRAGITALHGAMYDKIKFQNLRTHILLAFFLVSVI